jgi:N-acetyl-anhydromuramyl-L-alanine amidase AmpD
VPVYKSIYDGPPRGYGSNKTHKKYIAIHNTSNNAPAVNEASYAKRRPDSVSSHYYVDDERIIQSLNTDLRAWHAGSTQGNSYAISYEFVGTNSKSRDWWLKNIDWDKAAKQIATDMKHFGIANRHLTSAQMRSGVTGIVTHDQMSRVWGGSDHNDPGPNFPMDHLIKKINQYLNPPKVEDAVKELEDMVDAFERAAIRYTDGRVHAMANGLDKVRDDLKGGGDDVWIVKRVKALETKVDRILAILEAQNKTS